MDKNKLKQLAGMPVNLTEKKWSGDVETNKKPPEGLFASGSKADIIKWLKENHKEFKSAMSALNFFINRAGKNLTADRKGLLENCKQALRAAYGVKEALEPFDLELIRRMAGLPVTQTTVEQPVNEDWMTTINTLLKKIGSEARIDGRVVKLKNKREKEALQSMCKDARVMCPEIVLVENADEEGEEDEAPALPEIVTSIAAKAEGKTGDELADLINKVYDAGVQDGLAQAEEKPDDEDNEVNVASAVEEAAAMTFSFNIDDEDKAARACVTLAKAGLTVDMEEAMGVFYFNFKTAEQLAKAKKVVGLE